MEFKPVVFNVGNGEYGIDINLIRGIEKTVPIVSVPNSNKNICGIINLRGEVVPVFSLRTLFGLPKVEYNEDTKFIIVKTESMMLALEVDKVEEIQDVNNGVLCDMPYIVKDDNTEYAKQVLNINGKLIIIMDIEKLLSKRETEELKKTIEKL